MFKRLKAWWTRNGLLVLAGWCFVISVALPIGVFNAVESGNSVATQARQDSSQAVTDLGLVLKALKLHSQELAGLKTLETGGSPESRIRARNSLNLLEALCKADPRCVLPKLIPGSGL
jgi:hypothetical protein